ncbi:putative trans-sialidase [Trypanosoma cruzi Dm28c]|uniref:Putative trans-sialidase n=1 Tax=Trypanosoma cruzi Dm28c TaxID=1416333 RepID=V5B181_TRYCR|nr:putative trans-sialidase [Trypanosoma cruzi Dm28c]
MSGLINVELLQGVDLFVPQTTLVQLKGGIVPVTTRDSFASPSLVSAGGVIGAFAEGHMDAEYQGGQLGKPFSSAFVAGCIDSVWNWSTVVGEVNERMHGGHTLCLVQRRERRVCVLCSAAQQSRRTTEFFFLLEALMCSAKVCAGERTAWSRNWLWVMSRTPRVASGVDGSNVATPNHSRNGSLLLLTKVTGRSSLLLVAPVL